MKRNAPDFTSGQFFALRRGADLALQQAREVIRVTARGHKVRPPRASFPGSWSDGVPRVT
jgi:hypothetical protein